MGLLERFFQNKNVKALADIPPSEVTNITIQHEPIGKSGTELFAGIIQEDYLHSMEGNRKAELYDKMRRGDARVKMCLSAIQNPIRSAKWAWAAADQEANSLMHAEFLQHVFFQDIGTGKKKKFKKLLNEALSMVAFGHCVFEVVHKTVINDPKFGSYIGLQQLGWRSPKTIEYWHVNEQGELESVEQMAQGDIEVRNAKMDARFLCIMTLDEEGDNYEGVSMLRPCYGAWSRKQMYLKLLAIGIERNAIPTPKAKVPQGKENTDEFTKMEDVLKALTSHEANYVIYPDGWDVDFFQAAFDAQKVISAINFENEEMVFAFLANFLALGSGGNGGAYSLGQDLSDFFLDGIVFIADQIAEALDEIGKQLIILNFGPQEYYPKLGHQGIEDKIGTEFADILQKLGTSKYLTPDDNVEDELRRRLKLVPMREEDKGKDRSAAASGFGFGGPPAPDKEENEEIDPDPDKADEEIDKEEKGKKKEKPDDKEKDLHDHNNSIRLAEIKARDEIRNAKAKVQKIIQANLSDISQGIADDIIKNYEKLPVSSKENAINGVASRGTSKFQAELKEAMAQVAMLSIKRAEKEIPSNVRKFSEPDGTFKLAEWDDLPKATQKRLNIQSRLLVQTTTADLEKVTFMQFGDSVLSTDSPLLIKDDILQAGETFTNGAGVATASGNAAARLVNQARSAVFFDSEVLEEIESFTFVNGDPTAEICIDLAGKTFRKDDPEAQRYFPPLHHNCESYITPNLVKGKNNPAIDPEGLKTKFIPTL